MNTAVALPLDEEQTRLLERLVPTLSPDQLLWVSGYLAGFRAAAVEKRSAIAPIASPSPAATPLTILYGSETGHAAKIAARVQAQAKERGWPVRLVDMADYRRRELEKEKLLLLITSTHGDGDPPAGAVGLCEFLLGPKAPRLEGVKFAVLGLGDSTYAHFCKAARDLDARLEGLGAERIHPRVECDVDYEDTARAWVETALGAFGRFVHPAPKLVVAPDASPRLDSAVYDRENPLRATLTESIVLTGRGSDKEVLHLELSLADAGVVYEPGDALAVVAANDPRLVADLLAAAGLDGDARVPSRTSEIALADALTHEYEITTLTRRFLERYAELADAVALRALLPGERRDELAAYMTDRHILDVVTEFPVRGLAAADFVGALRKLQPRSYSLASSLAAYPEEAHLTVAVVRYAMRGRARDGVASTYLADRVAVDEAVPVYVEPNKNFKLPPRPETDIVMIGAGTGVAPFRAFVQERVARGATGRSWLFFGERRFRTDFLYQLEWQQYLEDGALTRLDVAFSRDQAAKVYVQHRLRERARELYDWLEGGAHLYLCGDAEHLAPAVDAALVDAVAAAQGAGHERAAAYVRALVENKRYQKDVY